MICLQCWYGLCQDCDNFDPHNQDKPDLCICEHYWSDLVSFQCKADKQQQHEIEINQATKETNTPRNETLGMRPSNRSQQESNLSLASYLIQSSHNSRNSSSNPH